jgi:hypothetical protein
MGMLTCVCVCEQVGEEQHRLQMERLMNDCVDDGLLAGV